MTEARDGMAAAVLNGKFYAIAGRTNNSVEIYDPQTEQWSLGPALPVPLYSAAAITINEKILVIGGYNSGNLNSVYEYRICYKLGLKKASMPTARYGHLVPLQMAKYGRSEEEDLVLPKTVEIYDVAMIHGQMAHLFPETDFMDIAWVQMDIFYVAGNGI